MPYSWKPNGRPHEEDISEPTGVSVPSEGDEHIIALLLPNGKSLEAIGSYSGIRSRALSRAQLLRRKARIRQARKKASSSRRKPAPTGQPRPAHYDGPRVKSVQFSPGTVMGQNIQLRINIDQLVPNARVDYVEKVLVPKDPDTGRAPECFFRIEEGLGRAPRRASASGEVTLSVSGWFHWSRYGFIGPMSLEDGFKKPYVRYSDTPKCGLLLRLKTYRDPRHPSYKEITHFGMQMSDYTTYRVRNTWELKDKFDFKLTNNIHTGICRGTSIGIPRNYKVGILKYGNDISMRIRSGPIGTNCLFASKKWYLPNGMFVSKIDTKLIYEGKPVHENNCMRPRGHSQFYRAADIPLVHTTYEAIPHDLRTAFTPWGVLLKCGLSVTNDHGVRKVIRGNYF